MQRLRAGTAGREGERQQGGGDGGVLAKATGHVGSDEECVAARVKHATGPVGKLHWRNGAGAASALRAEPVTPPMPLRRRLAVRTAVSAVLRRARAAVPGALVAGTAVASVVAGGAGLLLVSPPPASAQARDTFPAPRGFVNDFAGVLDAATAQRLEALAQRVRDASRGEIAVVTLRDIGERDAGEVALRIGRQWGVGAAAEAGDATKNAGVVILVVPKETSSDGRGKVSITTGRGVEGFIPDAVAGDIRREAMPYLQRQDYSGAIALMTVRVAERYAQEFGFSLEGAQAPPQRRASRGNSPIPGLFILGFIILMMVLSASSRRRHHGRRDDSLLKWILISALMDGRGGRGGGGGWGGGGGGGFGGGFGGFGGGGGFSGGGSSGSW
jgi:uncharacterized protein